MLHCNKTTIRVVWAAVCLILLAVALRYVRIGTWWGDDVPFACLESMIYVGLLLYWGISLRYRLTDVHVKRLLFASIALIILWFVLRCAKYDFFDSYSGIRRHLWYSYYITLNYLPTLSLMAAWRIGRRGHEQSLRLLFIPDSVFTVLVLTNDIHQKIFGFPAGYYWEDSYEQLPLFFVMCAFMAVQYLTALAIIFHQCRISRSRHLVWLPILWILVMTIFFFWYNAFQFYPIRKPFGVTEAVSIIFAAVWESCIETGLIPSNIGYREFFMASTVGAQIVDRDGKVRFSSGGALMLTDMDRQAAIDGPIFLGTDIRLQSRPIRAGRVYWKDDLTVIHNLNRELAEARTALSEENDLIREENRIREEKARLQEQNRLYDNLADAARPQISRIRQLIGNLTPDAPDFYRRLGMACVLNAYIKRSSNLCLLAEKEQAADAEELALCIRESLDYISVCGVACSLTQIGKGRLLLSKMRNAYTFFEETVENILPDLSALLVNLSVDADGLTLRLMMDGPEEVPGAVEMDGTFYRTYTTKREEER